MKLLEINANFKLINSQTDTPHPLNTAEKWEYSVVIHQLLIDFQEVYNSIRKEVLHNILTEFGRHIRMI
jgi:hypothetical protein